MRVWKLSKDTLQKISIVGEAVTVIIIQRNDASQFKRLIELPTYPVGILEKVEPTVLKVDNVEIAKLWCTVTRHKSINFRHQLGLIVQSN
jgi:hypothetical protein